MNTYGYVGGNPVNFTDPTGLYVPLITRVVLGGAARFGFPNAARMAAEAMGGGVIACIATGYCSTADNDSSSDAGEDAASCPVNKENEPNHPDFIPHKKNKGLQKIPWNKNRKGFPDKGGDYWEPVPDGHKGTHDPHWDRQHPDGSHTPTYPLK